MLTFSDKNSMGHLFQMLWLFIRRKAGNQPENEFLGYESFSERNLSVAKASTASPAGTDPYKKAA